MAGKRFSLGDYIGASAGVSELDREVITRIPLDLIDPAPCNFYRLEGLDELAANIELVGLLDPLRVRPLSVTGASAGDSSPGGGAKEPRYVVVSGHRRRAALMLIRDGGGELFQPGGRYADGVPCIVEYGEASDAMRELRLIFANSSTRVMSAAEISRQAERVTELLYELSKQGVEFPGRMRDHVAEACRVSSTKLARLHAIRERLVPELLARFDRGEINESVAYRISREETGIQAALAKAPAIVRGETAEKIGQIIDKLKAPATPVGADPQISPPTLHKTCVESDSLKNYLEERAKENEKYFEMLSEVADCFLPCIGGVPSRQEGIAALKQEHGSCHHGGTGENCLFQASLKGLALEPDEDISVEIFRTWTEVYDLLCTIAVARLLAKDYWSPAYRLSQEAADVPAVGTSKAKWQTGTPAREGRYLCRLDLGLNKLTEQRCDFRDGAWTAYGRPVSDVGEVVDWWPLPEEG